MLLAIDQGTTGTTCLVVDESLRTLGRGYQELRQHFPAPGLVEHDADEIWQTVIDASAAALADAGMGAGGSLRSGSRTSAKRRSSGTSGAGAPIGRAIVWQDRRTAARCSELPVELIRERTGLIPDPYFSATKLEWLLTNVGACGDLAFGTIDSWLLWKLCGEHVTDVSNASRTMLLDITTLDWDDELLDLFSVPRAVLPRLVPSSGVVGEGELLGAPCPSVESPAISRRRSSGKRASRRARRRRPTGRAPSRS